MHHKRCDTELDRQDRRTRHQSEKGKKGAKLRWENKKKKQAADSNGHIAANASAIATLMLGDSRETIERDKKEKPSIEGKKKIPVENVTVAMVHDWAAENIPAHINLNRELFKFQNHEWKKKTPTDGVKAFRNWLIKATEINNSHYAPATADIMN